MENIGGKLNEGDESKSSLGHISRKNYEDDELEKNVDLFEKQLYPEHLRFWPIRKSNPLLCLENIKPIFCL